MLSLHRSQTSFQGFPQARGLITKSEIGTFWNILGGFLTDSRKILSKLKATVDGRNPALVDR